MNKNTISLILYQKQSISLILKTPQRGLDIKEDNHKKKSKKCCISWIFRYTSLHCKNSQFKYCWFCTCVYLGVCY